MIAAETRNPKQLLVPPVTAASDRFGKKGFGMFGPETERVVRNPLEAKKNPGVGALISAWELLAREMRTYDNVHSRKEDFFDERLNRMPNPVGPANLSRLVRDISFTSGDITDLSFAFLEHQNDYHFNSNAGFFLSHLVNACPDEEFVIHTAHLESRIASIGIKNTKRIIVRGDVGAHCGALMESGSMIVEGDAGDSIGSFMKGGSIVVLGNAGLSAGNDMEGGSITIEGNAGDFAGRINGGSLIVKGNCGKCAGIGMKSGILTILGRAGVDVGSGMAGGEIRLEGDFGSIKDEGQECVRGGRIFHKGVQIWPNGGGSE